MQKKTDTSWAMVALVFCTAIVAISSSDSRAARASDYPNRLVKIVVPYGAGGAIDLVARKYAQKLSELWKQPVIVDNRAGAGGVIGTNLIAKSAPDGYNLLVTAGSFTLGPSTNPNLPYNIREDFRPVTTLVSTPYALVVNSSLPITSVQDLLNAARQSPGKLKFASGGFGTVQHLALELLRSSAGIDLVHVPYNSSIAALTGVASGEVIGVFDTPSSVRPFVESGRARLIATAGTKRIAIFPDSPTMIESGIKDFEAGIWFGVLAPKGVPDEIIQKILADTRNVMESPDVLDLLKLNGLDVSSSTPEAFRKQIADESVQWGDLVKRANLHFE